MQKSDQTIIAIDGYSSCGKSTFARLIARDLNYVYIDSGAMYRAVALYCIENGILSDSLVNLPLLQQALPEINIRFSINAARFHL
jgi:cytidylate kinase